MNVTASQETQPSQPAGIILSLRPPRYPVGCSLQNGESQHPALTFIFSLSHGAKQKEVLGSGLPTRVVSSPSVTSCQQAAVDWSCLTSTESTKDPADALLKAPAMYRTTQKCRRRTMAQNCVKTARRSQREWRLARKTSIRIVLESNHC